MSLKSVCACACVWFECATLKSGEALHYHLISSVDFNFSISILQQVWKHFYNPLHKAQDWPALFSDVPFLFTIHESTPITIVSDSGSLLMLWKVNGRDSTGVVNQRKRERNKKMPGRGHSLFFVLCLILVIFLINALRMHAQGNLKLIHAQNKNAIPCDVFLSLNPDSS